MKYILKLKSNGEGFKCYFHYLTTKDLDDYIRSKVKIITQQLSNTQQLSFSPIHFIVNGNQFFLRFSICDQNDTQPSCTKIDHPIPSSNIPEFAKQALLCSSREDVLKYINKYLLEAKRSAKIDHAMDEYSYSIIDNHGKENVIFLMHASFREREMSLHGHAGALVNDFDGHSDSPIEMRDFIENRNLFFNANFEKGKNYQKTPWYNPSWILTFFEYYFQAMLNKLAYSIIGTFIFKMQPTHFCEDFDLGYEHTKKHQLRV